MLITIGAAKGSPGVSTLAGLLAALWPVEEPGSGVSRVLLEADADGGVLAARWRTGWGTTWQPGVSDFVSQARTGVDVALANSIQDVGGGVGLLPALPSRRAGRSIGAIGDDLAAGLAGSDAVVVADVGRVRPETLALCRRSKVTLLVVDAGLEGVQATGPLRSELVEAGGRCGLVVVGDSGHSLDEYAEVVGVATNWVWQLPLDARAARSVAEAGPAGARVHRSRLGRAVSAMAIDLDVLTRQTETDPVQDSPVALWGEAGEAKVSSSSFSEVAARGGGDGS